jgi:hypothetical protein
MEIESPRPIRITQLSLNELSVLYDFLELVGTSNFIEVETPDGVVEIAIDIKSEDIS